MKSSQSHRRCAAPIVATFVLLSAWHFAFRPANPPASTVATSSSGAPASLAANSAPAMAMDNAIEAVPEIANRPLPVAQFTETHEWAAGDASDPVVIEKLAHNPDEFIRMVEENDRIHRRQLVYRKVTADAAIQLALASGEPLRSLTIPGLDGQDIKFLITGSEVDSSGQFGTFTGQLPGRPESLVTLAFKGGREAFSVSSPTDGLYLEAEPREPGQVIVKAIDPKTYAPGRCGTPEYAASQSQPLSK